MNKPIYRHLADRKWRSYDYKLITQRISQFHIVPDVLPKLDPVADVQLFFRSKKTAPGAVVDSLVSESPPRLRVQTFDGRGERLVTVVVVDADVPVPEEDGFRKRCHFLAANVPLSPTAPSLPLSRIRGEDQLAVPWLPPFAHKGSPYHRLAIFVLEQKDNAAVDVAKLRELYANHPPAAAPAVDSASAAAAAEGVEPDAPQIPVKSQSFSLKSLRDRLGLRPVGFSMFRTVWDEHTAGIMERSGQFGADLEFRRNKVVSLKPPRKAKGWEAKRQGPKFRHLWKYTKRIRGLSNSKGWIKKGN